RFASGAREARKQVSDYAGKLGDLFGGGAYTRLHIAAVLEVLCLISIVSLSVWAPETPRIEKRLITWSKPSSSFLVSSSVRRCRGRIDQGCPNSLRRVSELGHYPAAARVEQPALFV